jgi:hypothetical protein
MRSWFIPTALIAVLVSAAGGAAARDGSVAAPADWGRALAEDARAFHDLIADNHPGPLDAANPGFTALLEKGLAIALERSARADSYEAWYFALQEYQASFDDGHLTLSAFQPMGHVWRSNWPGFLTGLRAGNTGDRHEVVFNRDPAAPPVGAVLVSCDGRPAAVLAEEVIGRGAGRWSLRSRRIAYASTLFVDQLNPYVARPESCVFTVEGQARAYTLAWRDLPEAVRTEGFAAARSPRFTAPIDLRPWSGGVWIDLGGFDGDPDGPDGQRLVPLQAEIEARADEIRDAQAVVFDLRGNNGGSSTWIYAIAHALWGEAWVVAHQPRSAGVDWRISDDNVAAIESYRVMFADNPEAMAWLNGIVEGLTAARARGEGLWRQGDDEGETAPAVAPTSAMRARTYVLTDYGCGSACLDAVDLLTALGAVQVGQETSADTVYMEVRGQDLPSGRVAGNVPMKVYRGRARGNNETARPAHEWTGALADTAGLEAWLAGIDAARRP